MLATGRDGDVTLAAGIVRRALGLRSTWITVGVLSLSRPVGDVPPGTTVMLTGRAAHVTGASLEQRVPGSDWQVGPALSVQPDVVAQPTAATGG